MVNALETQLLPVYAFEHFGDVRDARDVDFVWHQFFGKKPWQELSGNIFLLMHKGVAQGRGKPKTACVISRSNREISYRGRAKMTSL